MKKTVNELLESLVHERLQELRKKHTERMDEAASAATNRNSIQPTKVNYKKPSSDDTAAKVFRNWTGTDV